MAYYHEEYIVYALCIMKIMQGGVLFNDTVIKTSAVPFHNRGQKLKG